jgi:hypothetical protein
MIISVKITKPSEKGFEKESCNFYFLRFAVFACMNW